VNFFAAALTLPPPARGAHIENRRGTIPGMAYDEDLANRIRELMADVEGVTEQKMFGGLAFLVHGHMSVAASREGGLLLRFDPDDTDTMRAKPHADPFVMRGRQMDGWLRVAAEGVTTKAQLKRWVERSVAYARTLPPKG
jgi:TfoX/Sxy family transcriptional regulator of competence genes